MSTIVRCFGVRHHGPGSARSLLEALDELRPDAVLIEGPPDANELIPLAAYPDMRPPVALLVHGRDDPSRAVFYPFAEFSPEWQALRFAAAAGIPAQFIDLPQAHRLALEAEASETDEPAIPQIRHDPLQHVAELAGYEDGERWWEVHFEEQSGAAAFAAIGELMAALRAEHEAAYSTPRHEQLREAHMRASIRRTVASGRQKLAVIVGAWHVPAVADWDNNADVALLRSLPRIATAATWIPWTYDRLSPASGYGAGITSPAYYQHLWTAPPSDRVPRWIAGAARLLREEDLNASTASVIDAVRLADGLAALRGQPSTGLSEMMEAVRAVLCHGADTPIALVRQRLIVGDLIGAVPDTVPVVPLQADLRQAQRRLRLQPEAASRKLVLDLRKPVDLERSHLLHRLRLLQIPWGQPEKASGQGTFREAWTLTWTPELEVRVIERARFGNTVANAAAAYVAEAVASATSIAPLVEAVTSLLRADLAAALDLCLTRLASLAATTHDVTQLMDALRPLAGALRYGDVRRTDAAALGDVVNAIAIRVTIGLVPACAGLGDDAAEAMARSIDGADAAIAILNSDELATAWHEALGTLADRSDLHGIIAGRAARRLADAGKLDADAIRTHLGRAVASSADPHRAAQWVEGFLEGGGAHLLHDDRLWLALDDWLCGLSEDNFRHLLPLLRRTFATFPAGERRQLGQRAARAADRVTAKSATVAADAGIDRARADLVTPVLALILGLSEDDIRGKEPGP